MQHAGEGGIKPLLSFPHGVGVKTLEVLIDRGLLERVRDPRTGLEGYRMTQAGWESLVGRRA